MTLRQLIKAKSGATAVEFAIISAPMVLVLTAILELSMITFVDSALESAALQASRFGTTGANNSGNTRREEVMRILKENTFGFVDQNNTQLKTLVYPSFNSIGKPEPYTDSNGNGQYDSGEPYSDINGNNQWDDDMGAAGLGGPSDVVVYHVIHDWGVLVPLLKPIVDGLTLEASVAVRNEPY